MSLSTTIYSVVGIAAEVLKSGAVLWSYKVGYRYGIDMGSKTRGLRVSFLQKNVVICIFDLFASYLIDFANAGIRLFRGITLVSACVPSRLVALNKAWDIRTQDFKKNLFFVFGFKIYKRTGIFISCVPRPFAHAFGGSTAYWNGRDTRLKTCVPTHLMPRQIS